MHVHGGRGNRELPETMGGTVALLDFEGDGDLDLYLSQSGELRPRAAEEAAASSANALYANEGGARFRRVEGAAGAGDRGYGQGLAVGDVDGDGWEDLLSLNWGPNRLYLNREGRFALREETGLALDRWSVSAAFFDGDADGDLDLYVVNYLISPPGSHADERIHPGAPAPFPAYPHPDLFRAEHDQLLVNEGGRLVERSEEAGIAVAPGKGLGVVPTDVEGDGWIDLYVANDSTPNFLFHNRGDGTFREVGVAASVAFNAGGRTEAGMGVDTADVDADGDLDLFVTNLDQETNTLYLNLGGTGAPLFRDATRTAGLEGASRPMVGFGTLFADLDLDGDPDLLVANGHVIDNIEAVSDARHYRQPNQVFLNDGAGRFAELPAESSGLFAVRASRGLASGDLDGDGDLDFAVGNNADGYALWLTETPEQARILWVELEGPPGNPRGLGAGVWVELEDGRRLAGRIESARSYASSSQPVWVTGLPARVRAIEVLWPGGRRERWSGAHEGRVRLAFESGDS